MAGTLAGGKQAAATNKKKYGEDFYKRIGQRGGKLGKTGGFASDEVGDDGLTGRQRARIVGAKGGRKSRRSKSVKSRLLAGQKEAREKLKTRIIVKKVVDIPVQSVYYARNYEIPVRVATQPSWFKRLFGRR